MGLWKVVEVIGCLLEGTERETVLGDIQERGVSTWALFDLIGLVALRQMQAWKSWRTWLLAASIGIPGIGVWSGAQVIADTASYYPWPDLTETRRDYFLGLIACRIFAIIGLAWATGFSITSLAKYRAPSILVPLALITMGQPISWTLVLLVGIPSMFGLRRGWRGDPIGPKAVLFIAMLGLPALAIPSATTWTARIYTLGAFWPAYYAAGRVLRVTSPERRSSR